MITKSEGFVKDCSWIAKIFSILYQSGMGLCGIDCKDGTPCVQLLYGGFMQLFGDSYEVAERQNDFYPWILYHMVKGVKFFCISDENPKNGEESV